MALSKFQFPFSDDFIAMQQTQMSQEPTDIYLIGLDVIFKNGKIKILEIQDIYGCDLDFTYQLTKLKPANRLLTKVKERFPSADIKVPPVEKVNQSEWNKIVDEHTRCASIYQGETIFVNRGLEPMLFSKWLFYNFCNQYPKLRGFIPQTFVFTSETLPTLFKEDPNKNYLLKPSDCSRGNGVMKLQKNMTSKQLKAHLNTVMHTYSKMLRSHPDYKETCQHIIRKIGFDLPIESQENEIMQRILSYLNNEDLESLSNTSTSLESVVAGYVMR